MVNDEALQRDLDDYSAATGERTACFVCPITFRECQTTELIDGHILNAAIEKASRRTVIQYGKIDGFYGTRVEPSLVKFLNLRTKSQLDVLKQSDGLLVEFTDGAQVEAFFAESSSGRSVRGKFPLVEIPLSDGTARLYLKTGLDDPRLTGRLSLIWLHLSPAHWVAAMLKVGFLTVFDMLGYRVCYDPYTGTVRRTLAQYFEENGKREESMKYFRHFRNAVKFIGMGQTASDLRQAYAPFSFDTLDDREVLIHSTVYRTIFAVTCIYRVNEMTVTVTLPQGTRDGDAGMVWNAYQKLMQAKEPMPQIVQRARFDRVAGCWNIGAEPITVHYC